MDMSLAKQRQFPTFGCGLLILAPQVSLWVIAPTALFESVCKFRPVQAQAIQGSTLPQSHNQAVEQRLTRESPHPVRQTLVKYLREHFRRIMPGAVFLSRGWTP